MTERSMPVPEGLAGMRVDAGLARLLGLSRTAAAAVAEDGGVQIDGVRVGKSDRLIAGALLIVQLPEAPAPVENTPVEVAGMTILYSDADIVAVDKPPGVAAHATVGWHGPTVLGGLAAAAATYYVFGRHLSAAEARLDETLHHPVAESAKGVLDVINRAGAEAFKIAVGAIPMLVLSLVAVTALKKFGAIDALTALIAPLLLAVGIDPILILPTLTKYLAGGTAMMGVMDDMRRAGQVSVELLNASAGFLISPFDLPGVAVLISAGRRVAAVWKPAAVGACVGILLRTLGHALLT